MVWTAYSVYANQVPLLTDHRKLLYGRSSSILYLTRHVEASNCFTQQWQDIVSTNERKRSRGQDHVYFPPNKDAGAGRGLE